MLLSVRVAPNLQTVTEPVNKGDVTAVYYRTGGDAPILSRIRLLTQRPILNHPHAEHKARRIREEQLYQVCLVVAICAERCVAV